MNIDYLIIGGGISGLNLACKIKNNFNNKTCALFEQSNNLGGRINTIYKKNMVYESGAARFNNKHKNLINLLKKYDLYKEKIPIKSFWDTIILKKQKLDINIHDFLNKLVKEYDNKKYDSILRKYTLYEFIEKKYGSIYSKYLLDNYSYYSEVCVLNAHDSLKLLKNDLNENNKFFILKCGLSELIKKMEEDFLSNKNCNYSINKQHKCVNVEYDNDTKLFSVKFKNYDTNTYESYITKNCIFACDGKSIQNMKFLNKFKIDKYIKSVQVEPLLRTYALYNMKNKNTNNWIQHLSKTVTDDKIKFIIPIYNGLVMISYTDGKYAKYWKKKNIR